MINADSDPIIRTIRVGIFIRGRSNGGQSDLNSATIPRWVEQISNK